MPFASTSTFVAPTLGLLTAASATVASPLVAAVVPLAAPVVVVSAAGAVVVVAASLLLDLELLPHAVSAMAARASTANARRRSVGMVPPRRDDRGCTDGE